MPIYAGGGLGKTVNLIVPSSGSTITVQVVTGTTGTTLPTLDVPGLTLGYGAVTIDPSDNVVVAVIAAPAGSQQVTFCVYDDETWTITSVAPVDMNITGGVLSVAAATISNQLVRTCTIATSSQVKIYSRQESSSYTGSYAAGFSGVYTNGSALYMFGDGTNVYYLTNVGVAISLDPVTFS